MLTIFFGNDVIRVRKEAFALVHTLAEAGASVAQVTSDQYQEGMIADLAEGASLFCGTQVCVIDTPSEDPIVFERITENLDLMESSAHHFVLIETTFTESEKKKFEKHATRIEDLSTKKKEPFNTFLLTDAFLRRDKKSLWLLLQKAWQEGIPNEEIIGVLLWQLKVLRLVDKTKSIEETGQKSFVYSKAKRALSSFKKREPDTLARTLLMVYHDGHRGLCDTSLALEKWVLTL